MIIKINQALKSIMASNTHPMLKIEVRAKNNLIFFSLKIETKENMTLMNARVITVKFNLIEKIIFRITNFIGILRTQIISQSRKLIKLIYQE